MEKIGGNDNYYDRESSGESKEQQQQSYFDPYSDPTQNTTQIQIHDQNLDRNLDRTLDQNQNQMSPSPLQYPSTVTPVYVPNVGTYALVYYELYEVFFSVSLITFDITTLSY